MRTRKQNNTKLAFNNELKSQQMIASKKPKGANSKNTKKQHKTKKSEEEITKNVTNKARNKRRNTPQEDMGQNRRN